MRFACENVWEAASCAGLPHLKVRVLAEDVVALAERGLEHGGALLGRRILLAHVAEEHGDKVRAVAQHGLDKERPPGLGAGGDKVGHSVAKSCGSSAPASSGGAGGACSARWP